MAFPDHIFDETHLAFKETCTRFAENEILPHIFQWEEAEYFPDSLFAAAGKAGILGMGFGEEWGGSGGTILHCMAGTEGLMRGTSTGVVAGLGSLGISLPPLMHFGTDEQREQFARPALAGTIVMALAVTEPGAGSDVSGIQTKARRDGSDYIINGSKLFITSGCRADAVVVLCRTGEDRHGGLTFFVVEKGMPGYRASKGLKKTGWRASDTAELFFEDVRVPESHRVGSEGSGFYAVMRNFQNERLILATFGHATAEICLEEAMRYAGDRKAFGKSLNQMQVIRHKLAEMHTKVTVAKTMNYTLGARVAAGEYLVKEVSMAKNFSANVALEVSYEAVQILGGMGYMRESAAERLSRDARLLPIGGGTQEIMNEIIAKEMCS